MKAPPTNPYQLRARALAAFLEDISDRNSRSFERTDALRSVVEKRNARDA